MATRVLDKDKVIELLRRYRSLLEPTKVGGGTPAVRFLCPFHNDTNPSFVFVPSTGRGNCFSCKKIAAFEQIIAAFENITPEEACKLIADCYKKVTSVATVKRKNVIDISMAQIQLWHVALETDLKLSLLIRKWGWTPEIIQRYLLGSSEGRLTIPMFEGDGLIGLKYYSPNATSGSKYQNVIGSAQCCWPLENLGGDTIYLVEGEKDCLTMISAGFNAVTFTSGAGGVPKDYIRFFAGKTVYIIYDIDEAGRNGAVTVAKALSCATKKVHIVELPLDGIPKGDLTDAYQKDPQIFVDFIREIVKNTDEYQAPAAISRVTVPPEVYKTYLEDIVPTRLFYRRVNMKVRVINNSQHETIIVPKDVELTCNKDNKDSICSSCPAHFTVSGLYLHVKPEYPELMSMVGNNTRVQRTAIGSMLGIAEGCPKFKVDQKSHQSLCPIVIIPAIEANKPKHSYSMVLAWALDVPSEENEDYDAEGVVLANPETQKLELVLYRMTKDTASLDSFELTDDLIKQLECFQCGVHPSTVLQTS